MQSPILVIVQLNVDQIGGLSNRNCTVIKHSSDVKQFDFKFALICCIKPAVLNGEDSTNCNADAAIQRKIAGQRSLVLRLFNANCFL